MELPIQENKIEEFMRSNGLNAHDCQQLLFELSNKNGIDNNDNNNNRGHDSDEDYLPDQDPNNGEDVDGLGLESGIDR